MSRKRKGRRFLLKGGIVLFGVVILSVTLALYLFKIRSLNVIGNRTVPKAEIIKLSGVEVGDNYLMLNQAKLKSRIEKNRYLEFQSTQFDYSGTLTFRLNERHAMGLLQRNGYYYVLDGGGMVLENSGMMIPENVKCPIINGLNMTDSTLIIAGEVIGVKDKEQLVALSRVLKALDETNMMGRTTSVDISNLENIYVMTTERARIVLGEAVNLKLKLIVAKEILHERQDQENLTGASIDISNGTEAHYIPAVLPTVTPTVAPTPTIAPPESSKK